jgi:predicted Zn-dependent peptidase
MRPFRLSVALAFATVAGVTSAAPPSRAQAETPATAAPSTPPKAQPSATSPAKAQPSQDGPRAAGKDDATAVALDVRRERLENGLRVVMSVDRTSPTIAVDVVYDVGSRNEERGRSGFAHLFEHMMFQGSANVPRGDHFRLVTAHGGVLNGTTSADRTNYFEMMPQSELALALWLEADRMKSLDVSKSNFENQRAVVKEEYRMRVENAAYVPASIRLEELVYQGYWPYEHSTIGSMQDLDAAQLEWVQAFHAAYYAPNNAVLSIAGDFDPNEAMTLVRKYFGDAKPQPNVPKFEVGSLPPQTSPREDVVEDAHAKLPAVLFGWAIPASREPDHYALELAAMLLGSGESSRLHRTLVRERGVAVDVDVSLNNYRGPDTFAIEAKIARTSTPAAVSALIEQELAKLAKTPPSAAEMTKVRNRLKSRFVFGLQSNFARAQKLAEFELYWGDARLLNDELPRYLAVTPDAISRAVATYLTKARSSRVEVKPRADEPVADAKAGPKAPATPPSRAEPKAAPKAAPETSAPAAR